MNYLSHQDYNKAWIFRHQELPVPEAALLLIKPLDPQSALQLWRQQVSREGDYPLDLDPKDWPSKAGTWSSGQSLQENNWQGDWESESEVLPESLAEHFSWEGNTVVYFCYDSGNIIETTWDTFVAHWKNFLFFDDGPLLIGKKRAQVVQFFSDGSYKLGRRA